jgi:N-formylglutamate amidohydrolase
MGAVFDLYEPTGSETPVVVEIPHAGLELPAQCLAPLAAPARALGRDADLYVDRLYADAPAEGATMIVARTSRYVVDLNRGEADIDAEVVEGSGPSETRFNHGLVWRTTSDGEPALARRLTRAEIDERLEQVYWPYHRAVRAALDRKRERLGVAVLLAAHSMPSIARPSAARGAGGHGASVRTSGGEAAHTRADVVPGSRGRTTASACFIDAVETHARAHGMSVRHDDPYAGGFSTQHYGRPSERVHAVQVEIARRLYLDESTLRPLADRFDAVRAWCRALVVELGRLALRT